MDNSKVVMDSMFGSDSEDETDVISQKQPKASEIAICKVIPGVGGGRGVFTKSRIEPGTLIIAENSFVDWKNGTDFSDPSTLINTIRKIVSIPLTLNTSRNLYPQTVEDMKPEDYDKMHSILNNNENENGNENDLNQLSIDTNMEVKELIRVALVLQHNGFQCGLYEQQCLINHSCYPNCVKFNPKTPFSPSEIWSTRVIEKNQEICICYVTPYESATISMRKYLWENHRFVCCCSKCKANEKLNSNSDISNSTGDVVSNSDNTIDTVFTSPMSMPIHESLQDEVTFEEELETFEATVVALVTDGQLTVHDIASECASIEDKLYKLMSDSLEKNENFNISCTQGSPEL